VLFGDFNPGGRLVQTWPKSLDQLPPMMDYNIRNGRTYMYFKGEPLYPFGYGLSFTTFKYGNLNINPKSQKGIILVQANITNTGDRTGDEVVQLYVKHVNSKVERPEKELKGFRRVTLKAGETKTIEISLNTKDIAYWDVSKHSFVVEDDKIKIMVGSSSQDIKLEKTIDIVP
jgi:beta-glucosidase